MRLANIAKRRARESKYLLVHVSHENKKKREIDEDLSKGMGSTAKTFKEYQSDVENAMNGLTNMHHDLKNMDLYSYAQKLMEEAKKKCSVVVHIDSVSDGATGVEVTTTRRPKTNTTNDTGGQAIVQISPSKDNPTLISIGSVTGKGTVGISDMSDDDPTFISFGTISLEKGLSAIKSLLLRNKIWSFYSSTFLFHMKKNDDE